MTAVPAKPPSLLSRGVVLGALALLAVGVLVAVVVVSQQVGGEDLPPEAPPFQAPQRSGYPRFEVRSVANGTAVLVPDATGGQSVDQTVDLPLAGVAVERLQRLGPGGIAVGDYVTVIGVQNDVRNFSIRSVVVQRGERELNSDGIAVSPAGFEGWEASKEREERSILSGRVTETDGSHLVIERAAGPVTLDLTEGSVLYLLAPADASGVSGGDRAAVRDAGGTKGMLVLPGE
ncbi:MAG: hypothetical protein ACM3S1_08185 [Hyphomicrobiales bacterium]